MDAGACRSKGAVVGEHPPARLGEFAGDRDRGDAAAALFAEPCALPFGERPVGWVAAGCVVGGLDQGPSEVGRPVLGERAAPVDLAGLAYAWAEAGVADQLARRLE